MTIDRRLSEIERLLRERRPADKPQLERVIEHLKLISRLAESGLLNAKQVAYVERMRELLETARQRREGL
jgi:hypothetical protein